MSFKTDMNDRERKRFAEQLRTIQKECGAAADALDAADDQKFMVHLLMVLMLGIGLREMQEVVLKAAEAAKAEEFPEIINT